ncbi:hypothetical protein ACFL4G_09925 [Thermodesulfobacteriota bacterium]
MAKQIKGSNVPLLTVGLCLVFFVALAGCGDDGKSGEIDTAAYDMARAEEEIRAANFSTASVYYEQALEKLVDADPSNDGDVPANALEKASYGSVLTTVTIPMKIIEGFIRSWLAGDRHPISRFIVEDYRRRSGSYDLPTNLITTYAVELIIPDLDQMIERIEAVLACPDFDYRLPTIRFTLFDHAYEIPSEADVEGLGRHDRVEASLFAALLSMTRWLALSMISYNLDMDVSKIDHILEILMGGDFSEMLSLVQEYPNLLMLSSLETNGVDGRETLAAAQEDMRAMVRRIRDDEDRDGYWETLPDGSIDPEENANDLHDALVQDWGDQQFDIVKRADKGIALNIRDNGASLEGGPVESIANLILRIGTSPPLFSMVERTILASAPPEDRPRNGADDDDDGTIDDRPIHLGLLMRILGVPEWRIAYGPDFFYGFLFDRSPDVRDMIPIWNEEAGDPDWFGIVVDRTESYEDLNGNGVYDPGIDVLYDAPHAFAGHDHAPDGRYQPVYLFLDDPTLGGILEYGPGIPACDRLNLFNLIVSHLAGAY